MIRLAISLLEPDLRRRPVEVPASSILVPAGLAAASRIGRLFFECCAALTEAAGCIHEPCHSDGGLLVEETAGRADVGDAVALAAEPADPRAASG